MLRMALCTSMGLLQKALAAICVGLVRGRQYLGQVVIDLVYTPETVHHLVQARFQ